MADNETKEIEAESEKLDKVESESTSEETLEQKLAKAEAKAAEAEKRVHELESEKKKENDISKVNDGGDIVETFKPPESAPKLEIATPDIDSEYEIEDWYNE